MLGIFFHSGLWGTRTNGHHIARHSTLTKLVSLDTSSAVKPWTIALVLGHRKMKGVAMGGQVAIPHRDRLDISQTAPDADAAVKQAIEVYKVAVNQRDRLMAKLR
jgi:hypothetical protein